MSTKETKPTVVETLTIEQRMDLMRVSASLCRVDGRAADTSGLVRNYRRMVSAISEGFPGPSSAPANPPRARGRSGK